MAEDIKSESHMGSEMGTQPTIKRLRKAIVQYFPVHEPGRSLNQQNPSQRAGVKGWAQDFKRTIRTSINTIWNAATDEAQRGSDATVGAAYHDPEQRTRPGTPSTAGAEVPLDSPQSNEISYPRRLVRGAVEYKVYFMREARPCAGHNLHFSARYRPTDHPVHGLREQLLVRLGGDLQNWISREGRRLWYHGKPPVVKPDFRWAGQQQSQGQAIVIELQPTVWISCNSPELREAIVDGLLHAPWLTWLDAADELRHGRIVVDDAWKWASGNVARNIALTLGHGMHLPSGHQLYLNVEKREDGDSACGLLLCTTVTREGSIVGQWISRVGGILELGDGRTVAVSTAHGPIEDMLIYRERLSSQPQSDHIEPTRHDKLQELQENRAPEPDEPPQESSRPLDKTAATSLPQDIRWTPIDEILALDFVHSFSDQAISWSPPHARDISLFCTATNQYKNTYTETAGGVTTTRYILDHLEDDRIDCIDSDSSLPEAFGDSYHSFQEESKDLWNATIILGGGANVRAAIMSETTSMYHCGVRFDTRSMMTEKQLREFQNCIHHTIRLSKADLVTKLASWCSGAWVVQQSSLVGIVIATYGGECMAEMLTAQKFLKDAQDVLESSSPIRLPAGLTDQPGDIPKPQTTLPSSSKGHIFVRAKHHILPSWLRQSKDPQESTQPRLIDAEHETVLGKRGKQKLWTSVELDQSILSRFPYLQDRLVSLLDRKLDMRENPVIHLELGMVGDTKESALPALIIACSSPKFGKKVQKVIRRSTLPSEFPEIKDWVYASTPSVRLV